MRQHGLGWILFGATLVAVAGARPYAGGWNDGSRLATVESLVDRRTFAIDDSIYLHPEQASLPPYSQENLLANQFGTFDKLYINGRYYSDKSPVPSVLMAIGYQAWRDLGGPAAAERPDQFAVFMSWLFAGLPFVVAVACVGRITRNLKVPAPWDLILAASFAFGSLAVPYSMQVNNHVLLLAVAAAICESLARTGPIGMQRAVWLGLLAGFGYTIDLGTGPPLVLALGGLVLWRAQRSAWQRGVMFALGALPFVAAHHAINYAISGSIGPANANPEFFRWPGSPFYAGNMTGGWNHPTASRGALYALELLGGKKGFLLCSPTMLLAVIGGFWLLARRRPERPTIIALFVWALATWLLYAATSRNMSGMCLSIRWFLPLLAPGMVTLGVLVRDVAVLRRPLAVLIAGGILLNVESAWRGPWAGTMPITFWPILIVTLTTSFTLLLNSQQVRLLFAVPIFRKPVVMPAKVLALRLRNPRVMPKHYEQNSAALFKRSPEQPRTGSPNR
jgi:hypothetical protein